MNTGNQLAYTGGRNAVFFQIRHQTRENVPWERPRRWQKFGFKL